MLSPLVPKMLWSSLAFLVVGMFLGNTMFLYLSLVPLFVVVCGLVFDNPGEVTFVRSKQKPFVWVNQVAEVTNRLSVNSGIGMVAVGDELPEHFQLVEGNNFRVFWKGLKPLNAEYSYKVKCTRRGIYRIGISNHESRHFIRFRQTIFESCRDVVELVVRVKPQNIKRMRDPRIVSRVPMPLGAVAKLGIVTTDFKEIREYSWGDSYRHINWKATARLASPSRMWPLVNEFEREGKKTVWVFLDGSNAMTIGTTVENAFEYALQTISGLAEFYLARNCYFGLYVYNNRGEILLPDSGRRQEFKLTNRILKLEVSSSAEPLSKAVEKCRGHMLGANPFFIVITTVRKDNSQELLEGMKELRKYGGGRDRHPAILLLHVMGYGIAASGLYENVGALLLEMRTQPVLRALRRFGVFVLPWDPTRQSLASLMVAGMTRR